MNIYPVKHGMESLITTILLGFSITFINSAMTTVILVLTALFWVQKNWKMFKNRNKYDKDGFN
jgi:hypothetical protein